MNKGIWESLNKVDKQDDDNDDVSGDQGGPQDLNRDETNLGNFEMPTGFGRGRGFGHGRGGRGPGGRGGFQRGNSSLSLTLLWSPLL